jgi:hypothetical protein
MRSLSKHPNLTLGILEFTIHHCDACNSSRNSTVYATMSDGPYRKMGFEPDSDEDSGTESGDERKEFVLGRFCAERARLFHAFSHWEVSGTKVHNLRGFSLAFKYSLFRSLESEICDFLGPDSKDGDIVMENLVDKNVIEQEFRSCEYFGGLSFKPH